MGMVCIALKWIGIIVAVCLLLLLLLCLVLLFAPFRYTLNLDTNAECSALFRIRFLFPFFDVTAKWQEGMPFVRARIFFIPFFDLQKSKKKKLKSKKKARKKAKKTKGTKNTNTVKEQEEIKEQEETIEQSEIKEQGKAKELEEAKEQGETKKQNETKEQERTKEQEEIKTETADKGSKAQKGMEEQDFGKNKDTILDKIKAIFLKIKGTIRKICAIIKKYGSRKDTDGPGIWQKFIEKKEKVQYLWNADETKEFLALCKEQFPILLRHIRPRKLEGRLHFGTGDPCLTGRILGVFAMFYPLYQKSFILVPDFEQACLEAKLKAKGSARLCWILLFAKKWYFSREFKRCKALFKAKHFAKQH